MTNDKTTQQIYLTRAVVALVWAGLLVAALSSRGSLTPTESLPATAIILLVLYPLIDVAASLVSLRARRTSATLVNAGISTVAVLAVALTVSHGADAVLRVFGVWAALTGLIQLTLALRESKKQWPIIASGGISTLAGLAFIQMSTKADIDLTALAGYATAGAAFFLIAAWRLRTTVKSLQHQN